jgi:hypothetical protein
MQQACLLNAERRAYGARGTRHRAQGTRLNDFELRISNCEITKTPINLAPQESLLPLETRSQFSEPVIPEGAKRLSGIQKKGGYWIPARARHRRTWPG